MPYIDLRQNSTLGHLQSGLTSHCTQCRQNLNGFGQSTDFKPDPVSENKFIDEEIKRGTNINDITNQVFWNRRPELRGFRLPGSCKELRQLQQEWLRIRTKITTTKEWGERFRNVTSP